MATDTTVLQSAPPVVIVGAAATLTLPVTVSNGYKGPEGAGAHTTITTGASSAQSSAITGSYIDVWCDQDVYIAIGANPTATSASYCLPKATLARFPITSGNKLAALQVSAAGTLHISVVL